MFTAVNSLYINQMYMDVVADNLSNVNTPGFKSSSVRFKDQFAQTMRVGSAPSAALGGLNPMQVGLGTNLASISPNFSQGALNSTGRDMDMAISGDGFFIYNHGDRELYSRDGSLALDAEGILVHSASGDRIQGWMANGLGVVAPGSFMEDIKVPINSTVARSTSEANLTGNLDANTAFPVTRNVVLSDTLDGTALTGATYPITLNVNDANGLPQTATLTFTKSAVNQWTFNVTGTGIAMDPAGIGTVTFDASGNFASNNRGITLNGEPIALNFSTVKAAVADHVSSLADGMTAGTYDVTMGVYDELGKLKSVAVRFTRSTANDWTYAPYPVDPDAKVVDLSGSPIAFGTVKFDTKGQFVSSTGSLSVKASAGSATPTIIQMDLSGLTMLTTANSASLSSQNGLAAGSLMGFNVSANTGEIYGAYSNGDQRLIGQLVLAMFANPSGLIREGGNTFAGGLNSGLASYGAPAAGGRGTVASGYVEGSNVDMSREFSNMILAQRGFQASSRIINTSDQMLQELVNLAR